jgi:GWxTD domain-containing protein
MTATDALSWTLVHFLWQGAVIGLITMVALWVARRPESRYVVGCLGLAAMGVATVGTYAHLRGGGAGHVLVSISSAPSMLEAALPWVNRVWAVGTTVLLLRALGGWLVARRRMRAGLGQLSQEWQERAFRLAQRLGVERRARVFESVAVRVPMVFGWVKPVVLLPACALSGLTVGQVEALLAHELAHVRRHDYLVNLVQTALESVLFYHPAVWWVSGRVRRERELCCDEVAVEVCGDRLLYSHALLRMEEARIVVAMAANGGSLQERVGRVLGMSETRMGWTPAWILGGVLLVCMGVVWAKTEQAPPPPLPGADRQAEDFSRAQEKKMQRVKQDMERANAEMERAALKMEQSRKARELTNERRARMEHEIQRMQREREVELITREVEMQAGMMARQARVVNEEEIERRMRYAEERFSNDGVNGLLTDRGRAYVKMGPPDEIESHPDRSENWRYRDGNRIVEFDGAGKLRK